MRRALGSFLSSLALAGAADAEPGFAGLGDLPGRAFSSDAYGISADGSTVVGQSTSSNGSEAFRWTVADGIVGLGDLPNNGFSSLARGASADGSVIVGRGLSGLGGEAFRWTSAGGMVGLGDLPDPDNISQGVAYEVS